MHEILITLGNFVKTSQLGVVEIILPFLLLPTYNSVACFQTPPGWSNRHIIWQDLPVLFIWVWWQRFVFYGCMWAKLHADSFKHVVYELTSQNKAELATLGSYSFQVCLAAHVTNSASVCRYQSIIVLTIMRNFSPRFHRLWATHALIRPKLFVLVPRNYRVPKVKPGVLRGKWKPFMGRR